MLKMTDVLEQNVVQNFSNAFFHSAELLTSQLQDSIINASDSALRDALSHFFQRFDVKAIADALDISSEHIEHLKQGISLKEDQFILDTVKVVALCLALETDTLNQVEVFDSLQDYPM